MANRRSVGQQCPEKTKVLAQGLSAGLSLALSLSRSGPVILGGGHRQGMRGFERVPLAP